MNRRELLAVVVALSGGGAVVTGTGAFTSVSADRTVDVAVTGDKEALLRLAPCRDNSDNNDNNDIAMVSDGTLALDIKRDSSSHFDNVFEVQNRGTQPICVDFQVDAPSITNVPGHREFEEGAPAVVFYTGSWDGESYDPIHAGDELDTDREDAIYLGIGKYQCIGIGIRTYGFEGEYVATHTSVEILAQSVASCENGTDGGNQIK